MTKKDTIYQKELINLLLQIDDNKLMYAFLKDILTTSEFSDIAKRLQIVKRLKAGEPQRNIAEDLSIGIATVTRGSQELKDPKGGFQQILKKYYS